MNSYDKVIDVYNNYLQALTSAWVSSKHDDDFLCFDETSSPHKTTLVKLNDPVCDLDMSNSKAKLLASRLQRCNLLEGNVRVTSCGTQHLHFESIFKKDENLVFCWDIDGLLKELRTVHELNGGCLYMLQNWVLRRFCSITRKTFYAYLSHTLSAWRRHNTI